MAVIPTPFDFVGLAPLAVSIIGSIMVCAFMGFTRGMFSGFQRQKKYQTPYQL